MPASICSTCGTQYSPDAAPPACCVICEDSRQFVGFDGQAWTTLEELRTRHHNRFFPQEPGLTAFHTEPKFAIGQRALLLETPGGNILWDCVPVLDDAAIETIADKGGLRAIAISHPHYYSTSLEWSRTFGDVPVYVHAEDREWLCRPDPAYELWTGETLKLWSGLTLIRCGGHFPGGAVLHWAEGMGGKGALLSGDILQVVPDRRWVSFMYSYPNLIPLNAAAVRRIQDALAPYAFERIYGAFPDMTVREDGKGAVARSVERYLRAIAD